MTHTLTNMQAQNQTVQSQLAIAEQHGEGPSSYQDYGATHNNTGSSNNGGALGEYGGNTQGFQNAVNARVVENM
jgi:erythrocyte band 7 integral membrane protein